VPVSWLFQFRGFPGKRAVDLSAWLTPQRGAQSICSVDTDHVTIESPSIKIARLLKRGPCLRNYRPWVLSKDVPVLLAAAAVK